METAIDKVLASPELVAHVGWHLDRRSAFLFSKSSRIIHQALAPHLWHTLDLIDSQREYRLLEKSNYLQTFAININHVKVLAARTYFLLAIVDSMARNDQDYAARATPLYRKTTVTPSTTLPPAKWLTAPKLRNTIQTILPPITRLIRLEYQHEQQYDDGYGNEPEPSAIRSLIWLLNLNPCLTVLRLESIGLADSLEIRLFARSLSTLTRLQELEMGPWSVVDWKEAFPAIFYCLPASLETLILKGDGRGDGNAFNGLSEELDKDQTGNEIGQPLPRRDGPLIRLKNLRINTLGWQFVELLCPLLEHCPAIESISPPNWIRGDAFPLMPTFIQAVLKYCPRFRQLDDCGLGPIAFLEGLPKNTLQSFTATRGYSRHDNVNETISAIVRNHPESIKEIRVIDRDHVRSGNIVAIFSGCTALEHFSIKGGDMSASRLINFVVMNWNCLRLKTLEITIDLRRSVVPAFVYLNRGEPMPNVDEDMWAHLEDFYRRLGSLKELEVLNLRIRSKEVTWLDDNGHVRKGGEHLRRLFNWPDDGYYGVTPQDDVFSVDDKRGNFASKPSDNLEAKNADASFPGLLSLGDPETGRRGYLSWLSGLTKLRELRGAVQATTTETSKTFGRKELDWMLAHWPNLKVIELLPALEDRQGKPRRLLPMDLSPPHIVWLQQHRPDIHIQQDSY
ncbi:hypothetical protein BGX29_002066 [Mortierella sp. GBA35]|nr:hypothetical protein BGX29_002066 [Mortierella sp. GBA35]